MIELKSEEKIIFSKKQKNKWKKRQSKSSEHKKPQATLYIKFTNDATGEEYIFLQNQSTGQLVLLSNTDDKILHQANSGLIILI